jgi:hypothetical protein
MMAESDTPQPDGPDRRNDPNVPDVPDVRNDAGDADAAGGSAPRPPARPSGLRNPQAAVRGVGAGALGIEALVLLLAIVPLHVLGVRDVGWAIGAVVALAIVCILLAGSLRYKAAWTAGIVVQVLLIACGYFHIALGIAGVLFMVLWLYVLSVRRTVLGTGRR